MNPVGARLPSRPDSPSPAWMPRLDPGLAPPFIVPMGVKSSSSSLPGRGGWKRGGQASVHVVCATTRADGMRRILGLLTLWACTALVSVWNGLAADGAGVRPPNPAHAGAISPTDHSEPVSVPEPTEKAIRFYQSGNALWCVRTFWELFVPASILFTGFSARLRDAAERIGRKWFFAVMIYSVMFVALKYFLSRERALDRSLRETILFRPRFGRRFLAAGSPLLQRWPSRAESLHPGVFAAPGTRSRPVCFGDYP